MRFDWYSATIEHDPHAVIAALAASLGAIPEPGKGLNGFTDSAALRRDGSVVARVLHGGNGGLPHAFASSDETDAFVLACRSLWPDSHRVSRFDAAQDYDGPGTWDRLYTLAETFALARGLRVDQMGDWLRGEAGRTFYVGSRKSAVFLRIYEKGKQQRQIRADAGMDDGGISDDWVRVELQVRPEKEGRYAAAIMQPEEAYGFSDWSRDFLAALTGEDVERIHIRERRESDQDRALWFLVRQYGQHLERLADDVGGWPEIGTFLERRYRQMSGREAS